MHYGYKQETFIGKYFRLGTASQKGWLQNLTGCPNCNDGRSKNPRSYFLFSNDEIGWQCFNCGSKHRFGGNNLNTLATFISKSSWKKVGSILFELKKEKIFPDFQLKNQEDLKEILGDDTLELINYKEVNLPDVSISYTMKTSDVSQRYKTRFKELKMLAGKYLTERGLTQVKNLFICMDGEYANRLIFPIYFDGKLISWTARALFPTKTKYLYPPSDEDFNDRGKIIYGLDKLFKSEDVKQIFVTESINDAINLGGMAVLSKNITSEQIAILKKFNFQKKSLIFVLDNDKITKWDRDLKGGELGKSIFKEQQPNWFVSTPNFGTGIKDVSESINKNGLLETYDIIMNSFVSDSSHMKMKMKLKSTTLRRKL